MRTYGLFRRIARVSPRSVFFIRKEFAVDKTRFFVYDKGKRLSDGGLP